MWKVIAAGGQPHRVVAPPAMPAATAGLSAWLILKAFASGCTAMTGVEAVSNGVRAFREPVAKSAQLTLTIIIAILAVMLLGIALLVRAYHVGATDPGSSGYQSVLSLLLAAVAGRGWFYWISYLLHHHCPGPLRQHRFRRFSPPLPCHLAKRISPLYVFSARPPLGLFARHLLLWQSWRAILLTIFGGVTDRLIPLYAVGAFLAFTLSQTGMVSHWRKSDDPRAKHYMMVNGIGAIATGLTVCRGAGGQVRCRRLDYCAS